MEVKPLQSLKQNSPNEVTEEGRVMEVNFERPMRRFFQYLMRCYHTLFYSKEMLSMRRWIVPRGILISTSSPTFLLSRP